MDTNYLDWPKTLLLIKNPQLLFNLYETWWQYSSHEYFMLLEYLLDWIKIVDFLLIANFWASLLIFWAPSTYFVFSDGYYMYLLLAKSYSQFLFKYCYSLWCSSEVRVAQIPSEYLNFILLWPRRICTYTVWCLKKNNKN